MRPVVFDVTRLMTRFSRPTPNGIDRVDIGYAQHFLNAERGAQAALFGLGGVRAVQTSAAQAVVEAVARHWQEGGEPDADPVYRALLSALGGGVRHASTLPRAASQLSSRRAVVSSLGKLIGQGHLFGGGGLFPARSIASSVPQRAIYLNVSQFPLWIDGYFKWLDRRPDIVPVFFIHDLLPLEMPEFFPPAEGKRHARRLEVLARRARGIIVASEATKDCLLTYFASRTYTPPPILVVPLPADPVFSSASAPTDLPGKPYFVSIGTMEPRKNQLMLLHVWRELVSHLGEATPTLVLIGARGWDNENVLDLLTRCEAIRPYVLEVNGLSTPAMATIMRGAAAVLQPTLAEGFGLPVAEARASGVTTIVSDIPAFRTTDTGAVTRLDPLDGLAWFRAILAAQSVKSHAQVAGAPKASGWVLHLSHVDQFIDAL